jgi:hypothetical protein
MRSLVAGGALIVVSTIALSGGTTPAVARDYPYCLQGRQWGYPGNCSFSSFAQCKAAASGTEADCGLNPVVAYGRRRPYRYAPEW